MQDSTRINLKNLNISSLSMNCEHLDLLRADCKNLPFKAFLIVSNYESETDAKSKPEFRKHRIFYKKECQYGEEDKLILEDFHKFVVSADKNVSKLAQFQNGLCLRLLYCESFNIFNAYSYLLRIIEFEKKYSILNLKADLLHSGILYIYGKDQSMQPNLYIDFREYLNYCDDYSENEMIVYVLFVLKYIDNQLLVPGQIEYINLIVDFDSINCIDIPKKLKSIIGILKSCYFIGVSTLYLIKIDCFMSCVVKGTLSTMGVLSDKIVSIKVGEERSLSRYFNLFQVQIKHGGFSSNVEPPFFPCITEVSEQYLLEKGYQPKFHNEEEYFNLILSDEIYYVEDSLIKQMTQRNKENLRKFDLSNKDEAAQVSVDRQLTSINRKDRSDKQIAESKSSDVVIEEEIKSKVLVFSSNNFKKKLSPSYSPASNMTLSRGSVDSEEKLINDFKSGERKGFKKYPYSITSRILELEVDPIPEEGINFFETIKPTLLFQGQDGEKTSRSINLNTDKNINTLRKVFRFDANESDLKTLNNSNFEIKSNCFTEPSESKDATYSQNYDLLFQSNNNSQTLNASIASNETTRDFSINDKDTNEGIEKIEQHNKTVYQSFIVKGIMPKTKHRTSSSTLIQFSYANSSPASFGSPTASMLKILDHTDINSKIDTKSSRQGEDSHKSKARCVVF